MVDGLHIMTVTSMPISVWGGDYLSHLSFSTVLDYVNVLLKCVRAPPVTQEWTKFVCDLATTCAFPPKTTLAQVLSGMFFMEYIH